VTVRSNRRAEIEEPQPDTFTRGLAVVRRRFGTSSAGSSGLRRQGAITFSLGMLLVAAMLVTETSLSGRPRWIERPVGSGGDPRVDDQLFSRDGCGVSLEGDRARHRQMVSVEGGHDSDRSWADPWDVWVTRWAPVGRCSSARRSTGSPLSGKCRTALDSGRDSR